MSRREVFERVAAARAAHFARAPGGDAEVDASGDAVAVPRDVIAPALGGVGPARLAGPGGLVSDPGALLPAARVRVDAAAEGEGEARQSSWPGPFSTGWQLMNAREEAAAARDADAAQTGSDALVDGAPCARWLTPGDAHLAALVAAYAPPAWRPVVGRAAAHHELAQAPRFGNEAQDAQVGEPLGVGQAHGRGAQAQAQAQASARTRRPIAVAGPSGVRLHVPSLAVLAMESLTKCLDDVASLGPLMPTDRARFAAVVCASRAMDGHAFGLFAEAATDELVIRDCAGVDEVSMIAALTRCTDLQRLDLAHCGRGFTDRTVAELVAAGVCTQLTHLRLHGAYVLTEGGVQQLLQHTPHLRHLALSCCTLLTGEFVGALHKWTPHLEAVSFTGCAFTDAHLLGTAAHVSRRSSGTDRVLAHEHGAALASSSSSSSSVEASSGGGSVGHKRPRGEEDARLAAAPGAPAHSSDAGGGVGLLALPHLCSLELSQVPDVTDAFLRPFLAARAPELSHFHVDRCPGITTASLAAVLTRCASLTSLRLDSALPTSAATRALPFQQSRMPHLTHLRLTRSGGMSAAQMFSFLHANASKLVDVSLAGMSAVTDEALMVLTKHASSQLRTLDVSFCRNISDAGVGALVNACLQLTRLNVWGCTQLTSAFFDGHARAGAADVKVQNEGDPADATPAALRIYGRPGDCMPAQTFDDV